jgi:hypothetical protein
VTVHASRPASTERTPPGASTRDLLPPGNLTVEPYPRGSHSARPAARRRCSWAVITRTIAQRNINKVQPENIVRAGVNYHFN